MRLLALITIALLVLTTSVSAALPAWTPACLLFDAGRTDTGYLRIVRPASVARGRSLSTTMPISMTVNFWTTTVVSDTGGVTKTTVLTETTRSLALDPYIVQPADSEIRLHSATPFRLYMCAPGFSPHLFFPYTPHQTTVPSADHDRAR